jgi:hypothetical protein
VAQKRGGRGRKPDKDDEAVSYVLKTRQSNPRLGYRAAALKYFQEHPNKRKKKSKPESEARRVGEKAAKLDRIPTLSELQSLKYLHRDLVFGAELIRKLLERWEKR